MVHRKKLTAPTHPLLGIYALILFAHTVKGAGDFQDLAARNVGVTFGGAERRMPEKLLNIPDIRSAFQKMGRE
jgi:hypothetical protein